MRRDAECCSVRCRQARHRFTTAVGGVQRVEGGTVLRLAYADPPYPGKSRTYYGDHPDYAGEVDHASLVTELAGFDGWALSTSAEALPAILRLCPLDVRVAAWVCGDRGGDSLGPLSAWEPVIYRGGRARPEREASGDVRRDASHLVSATRARRVALGRARRVAGDPHDASRPLDATRRTDALVLHSNPRLTDPKRVVGAKPAAFCRWMFDLLGAEPQDEFTDLFPGSGGVARAWGVFSGN
jgi:hypothetical protein